MRAAPQPPKPAAHSRAIDPTVVAPPELPHGRTRAGRAARAAEQAGAGHAARSRRCPTTGTGRSCSSRSRRRPALIEAKGYSVAVSGIRRRPQDETCTTDGKSWPCGVRARTAFRAFLRGRAVICTVPPEGGRDLIAAQCRIGKQDVGQWLVDNGWARAGQGGPYVEAGDKARRRRRAFSDRRRTWPACRRCRPRRAPAPQAPSSILEEVIEDGALKPADQPAPAQ